MVASKSLIVASLIHYYYESMILGIILASSTSANQSLAFCHLRKQVENFFLFVVSVASLLCGVIYLSSNIIIIITIVTGQLQSILKNTIMCFMVLSRTILLMCVYFNFKTKLNKNDYFLKPKVLCKKEYHHFSRTSKFFLFSLKISFLLSNLSALK